MAGSVKWLASPFDRHDLNALAAAARQIPGHTDHTGLAVATLNGLAPDLDTGDIALCWGPDDIIRAWET